MNTRVIYADPATSRDLASLAYEELGRVDDGVWVACPDPTVQVLAQRRPPVWLYFDRRGYDVAVAGLSPPQVQEVIRRRRDRWAPQAWGYVLSWLFDLERVSLEAALRMADRVSDQAIPAPIEQSLTLLQRLAGLDRYARVPAKAMGVTVLESESLLLSTVSSAVDSGLFDAVPEDKSRLMLHRDRRRDWAKALSRAAAALGAGEFTKALPFADPARGVFIHPADEGFERALARSGEPAVRWRDGVVCVVAERRFAELRSQGHSMDVLYADAGDFYDSVESLTRAQLQRDFAARLGRPVTATRQDLLGQIDRLHLHQLLMERELRQRSDATQACETAGFDTLLGEEVELLGRSLGRTRTFSRSQGMDTVEPPLALLRTAEDTAATDAAFFAALAARYWSPIAHSLGEIAALKAGSKARADALK